MIGRYSPTVWLLTVGRLVDMTTLWMAMPFISIFIRRAGASYETVGLVLALGPVAQLLGNLLGGQWSDRKGRRPVILASMVVRILVLVGFAYASAVWQFAVLWFGHGLVNALFNPAYLASIADVTPLNQRASAYSLSRVMTNFGVGVGPLLGSAFGIAAVKPIFLTAAVSSAAVTLAFCLWLPEPMQPGAGHAATGSRWRQTLESWSTVFTDRALLVFILAGILSQMAYTQIHSSLSLHLSAVMAAADFERVISLVWTLNGILVVLLQLPLTAFFTRFPMVTASLTGCFCFALGYAGFALAVTPLHVHLATSVWTVGEIILAVSTSTYVTDIAPPELRARYVGAGALDRGVGGIIAPIAGTALLRVAGGRTVMFTAAAIVLLAGVLFAAAERERTRRLAMLPM